ncbi:hypothetical protein [Bradyrhizobium erythrophlei]|nr:hypothetical protein [Bradyrhizobium erythrophlei]
MTRGAAPKLRPNLASAFPQFSAQSCANQKGQWTMQQVDLIAAKAAKATERRALAILAYDNATANPDGANWRGIADLLRLALPAQKAGSGAAKIPDGAADPWADYVIPASATKKLGKSPIIVVTFACGAVVRAPAVSLPGKPVNIGRGLRVAFAFYRARIAREFGKASAIGSDCVAVPSIISAICDATGAEYPAEECNARTAEYRRGRFDHVALSAEASALPETAEAGGLTRADFYRGHYLIASAEAEILAGADEERAAELGAQIADYRSRLGGMAWLEIEARRRAIVRAAEAEAKAAAKAEAEAGRRAEQEAEARAAAAKAEAEAPRLRLVADNSAGVETAAASLPDTADSLPVAPAPNSAAPIPVAPSRAARFLASSSLGAPRPSLPVAPLCAIRAS